MWNSQCPSLLDNVTKQDGHTTVTGGEPAGYKRGTDSEMTGSGRSSTIVESDNIDTSGWIRVKNKRRGKNILSEEKGELANDE
mmetsp:Transcript_21873/g.37202  ORF Transcript_21873/g.37202 Transcript_21873/m.37202 type:complete len:83 (-) Transcript_21873:70-318(-)